MWNGVTSALANGETISDLSVFSESGFDYSRSYARSAVPEPSTYGFFGAAGLLLLLLRRGQKSINVERTPSQAH